MDNEIVTQEKHEFPMFLNKHYIEINSAGNIIDGWSDGPTDWKTPTDSTICINEEGSYQFRLFPGGEENPNLFTMMGIPIYHYNQVTGEITQRSEEEIAAETAALPPPPPSRLDKIEGDLAFVAAMTDIDLDE